MSMSGAGYGEASKRLLSDNQYIPSLYYTGARGAASGGEGFGLPNCRQTLSFSVTYHSETAVVYT